MQKNGKWNRKRSITAPPVHLPNGILMHPLTGQHFIFPPPFLAYHLFSSFFSISSFPSFFSLPFPPHFAANLFSPPFSAYHWLIICTLLTSLSKSSKCSGSLFHLTSHKKKLQCSPQRAMGCCKEPFVPSAS